MESPPGGYPRHPPALHEPLPHILHMVDGKCEPQVRDLLARITRGGWGEDGVIRETMPFDNGSSDQLQTQNQDSQHYSAPLLFRQIYWILTGGLGKLRRIYIVEGGYKREPEPVAI